MWGAACAPQERPASWTWSLASKRGGRSRAWPSGSGSPCPDAPDHGADGIPSAGGGRAGGLVGRRRDVLGMAQTYPHTTTLNGEALAQRLQAWGMPPDISLPRPLIQALVGRTCWHRYSRPSSLSCGLGRNHTANGCDRGRLRVAWPPPPEAAIGAQEGCQGLRRHRRERRETPTCVGGALLETPASLWRGPRAR
jgi:hypothetical protein